MTLVLKRLLEKRTLPPVTRKREHAAGAELLRRKWCCHGSLSCVKFRSEFVSSIEQLEVSVGWLDNDLIPDQKSKVPEDRLRALEMLQVIYIIIYIVLQVHVGR